MKLSFSAFEPMLRTMSQAGWYCSIQSSGCGSTLRVTPSRSRMGSSSSIERNQAASQASLVLRLVARPLRSATVRSGEAPRPNSLTMRRQSISTATSMAFFQQRTAHWRSSSKGLAQRYIGCSEARPTPAERIAALNSLMRGFVARGMTHQSRKSLRGDSSIWS